jgi:hypothetical protein
MTLRWLVRKYRHSTWDSRNNEWLNHEFKDPPVLQYRREQDGVWMTLPIHEEAIGEWKKDE